MDFPDENESLAIEQYFVYVCSIFLVKHFSIYFVVSYRVDLDPSDLLI